MSFGGIKRNQADAHFSRVIRMASTINGELRPWHCQLCETDYTDRNRQGIQCSHFIGRGINGLHGTYGWAVRYDPLNALSLCSSCHGFVEAHPVAHINLWREVYGSIYGADRSDSALNDLLRRSTCKSRAQYARQNTRAISTHYLAESRRLEEEIIKYEKGKEADYAIYSYITGPKALSDPGRST
jgi:hypothetical protein